MRKTAPRVLVANTETATLRPARLIMLSPVMMKAAMTRLGDTPPMNCKKLRTGSPVSMKSTR